MNYIYTILCLISTCFLHAQQTPGYKLDKAYTIKATKIFVGDGTIIEEGKIIIQNGKIAYIGEASQIADRGTIIDVKGQYVYPGFIAPNTTLGLAEIDAVRASRDDDEVGTFNPHIRSLIAYNSESRVVETMRPNGVLIAQITPRGGRISGTSSIVQLDAWNWEDAAIKIDDGIHLNWPNLFTRTNRWWNGEHAVSTINMSYEENIEKLTVFFNDSKTYNLAKTPHNHLPFEAMKGLFNGDKQLFIHVNDEKCIIDAVNFAKKFGIKKNVIVGGLEADKVTDFLKDHDIPVLLKRVHSLPVNNYDDYDRIYKLAYTLHNAKLLVGLETSGSMERMQTRNLPFLAGTCAAFGMLKQDALKLITSNTAKILGIDDNYGTLERGKSATLFVSYGDALDMKTNKISHAFIDGRKISLETHQTQLYERYSTKHQRTGVIAKNTPRSWKDVFKDDNSTEAPSEESGSIRTNSAGSGYKVNNQLKNPLFYEDTEQPDDKAIRKQEKRAKKAERKEERRRKKQQKSVSNKTKTPSTKTTTKKKTTWKDIIKNTNREEYKNQNNDE